MKFFLDTANTDELRQAAASGLLDGVTTNPSLIAKTGRQIADVIKDIVEIVDGPISAEVISLDAPGMIAEGTKLAAMHKNIVVKVPLTEEGLKATKHFSRSGIKTNVTLVFSALQALLAAKAGATYCSPFIGRLDDIGQDGMHLIEDIRQIYDNYEMKTEILAASLRHPQHVLAAALAGADVGTLPLSVFKQLFKHPLTDSGLEKFLADAKSAVAKG
jgi:transaldolase